jgi:Chain length determinant protein
VFHNFVQLFSTNDKAGELMDLLSISRTMWRHKLLVLPVVAVTLIAAFYFLALSKPLYEVTNDYVLAPPPAAPTAAQIIENPSLGKINPNNVYARFYDQSIIADALAARMNSQVSQTTLVKEGADPRNTVTLTSVNGTTEPGVEVLGTGSTSAEALKTSELVGAALRQNLYDLQSAQGTDPHYMFTAIQVASSGAPQVKLSSKLRSVLAVLGLGALLLFVVVSVGDAVDKRRAERRSQGMRAMVDAIPDSGEDDSSATWEPALIFDDAQRSSDVPSYPNGGGPQRAEAPR